MNDKLVHLLAFEFSECAFFMAIVERREERLAQSQTADRSSEEKNKEFLNSTLGRNQQEFYDNCVFLNKLTLHNNMKHNKA